LTLGLAECDRKAFCSTSADDRRAFNAPLNKLKHQQYYEMKEFPSTKKGQLSNNTYADPQEICAQENPVPSHVLSFLERSIHEDKLNYIVEVLSTF